MAGANDARTDESSDELEHFAEVARRLNGLGHPLRIAALLTIAEAGPSGASPSVVARRVGTPLSNMSYHVKTLGANGLVRQVRSAQRRGAIEHFYTLTEAGEAALGLVRALEPSDRA